MFVLLLKGSLSPRRAVKAPRFTTYVVFPWLGELKFRGCRLGSTYVELAPELAI